LDCAEEETFRSALAVADLLGKRDLLEPIQTPLKSLAKERLTAWRETFSLVVVSLSPYAVVRLLKYFFPWLVPGEGRLIVAGAAAGQQAATLIKNAFKAGFALEASAESQGQAMANLARRKPNPAPVWDWVPGAWLDDLTEDELTVLAEAEALENRGASHG
jgi:hypothetical protein